MKNTSLEKQQHHESTQD